MVASSGSLLVDLSRLLEAGMAPLDAVAHLASHSTSETASLDKMASALRQGRSLADAIKAAGMASQIEIEILKVAEHAGKLTEALRLTARQLEQRSTRASALRARLWLPNILLLIVVAVGVVRAVTAGQTVAQAAFAGLPVVVFALLFAWVLERAARADRTAWLSIGWSLGAHERSALFRRFFEQTFCRLLTWQIEAGVDAVSGARVLSTLLGSSRYRSAAGDYRRALAAGKPVAESIRLAGLVREGELAQVIHTGEQSGRLGDALRQYFALEDARLESVTSTIYTWLPRFYYFAIVVTGSLALFQGV